MDARTFDRLARAAGAFETRRRLLGLVSGVTLGGLLVNREDGTARRKHRGHRPGKGKDNRKGKRKGKGKGKNDGGGLGDDPCYETLRAHCVGVEVIDCGDANLSGVNLAGCILSEVGFFRADLSGANLTNADLNATLLAEANLSHANLTGAKFNVSSDVSGATFDNTTCPDGTNSDANTPESCCGHYIGPQGACPALP